jgi:hypothetical protein
VPGTAPFLSRLHNYTFGATPSLGITGAAITGLRYGVPRLVHGLVGALFREDAADHYRDLQIYSVPDLETLESPSAWIDRLAADALDACRPIDEIDQVLLTGAFAGGPALQCSDDVAVSPPPTRPPQSEVSRTGAGPRSGTARSPDDGSETGGRLVQAQR